MKLAIYTPTYNRANELVKLYQSLVKQKNKDFFWLVIDDGSEDETENIVKEFKEASNLEIKYYKQNNQIKCSFNLIFTNSYKYLNIYTF